MERGRFAPSPSGRMHLGNVLSALLAWLDVRHAGGIMVLRMEDLDPDRCREEYARQAAEDLAWLGLDWDEGYGAGGEHGPYRQSERGEIYGAYVKRLEEQGLIYPCWCTRAQRLAASAPHPGEARGDGACPCRALTPAQLAGRLAAGDVLLAMGNSDVPVGQYTQKIFAHYGLDEGALASAGVLTYGTNVKEVTAQVAEGSVDCGIVYATDAYSAGLTVVDTATAELCGQVLYPGAVLSGSAHPAEAAAFLDYLSTPEAMKIFASVGFSAP